jgi:hypothetical protein
VITCLVCCGIHLPNWCPADRHAVNRVAEKPHLIRHRGEWEAWSRRGQPVALKMAAKQHAARLNGAA